MMPLLFCYFSFCSFYLLVFYVFVCLCCLSLFFYFPGASFCVCCFPHPSFYPPLLHLQSPRWSLKDREGLRLKLEGVASHSRFFFGDRFLGKLFATFFDFLFWWLFQFFWWGEISTTHAFQNSWLIFFCKNPPR